jgi:hypothetical protein
LKAASRLSELIKPASRLTLILLILAIGLLVVNGCGNSSKPQVQSITFTADSAGLTPICTTALTSQNGSNAPLCGYGSLPSLTAGGPSLYMYANVTSDDQVLGVTWVASCGSATSGGSSSIDTACGTFTPAETTSGPVPAYPITGIVTSFTPPSTLPKGGMITISAQATSLPSISQSITLAITAAPSENDPSLRAGHKEQPHAPSRTESRALNPGIQGNEKRN